MSIPVVLEHEPGLVRFRSFSSFLRQLLRRPSGLSGVAVLVVFTVLAVAPGLFVGPLETVTTASATPLEPPRPDLPFGSDSLGRSVLNLTVWGTRISMTIGLLATIVTVLLGSVIRIRTASVRPPT